MKLLLPLVAGCTLASQPRPATPVRLPTSLPPVELVTLAGAPTSLDAAVAGRVALVSLWATWCQACVAEIDALNRLAAAASERGGLVVAVAVGEARRTVAEFARRRSLLYPQLVDSHFRLADALGQRRVPTTLVLDRAGRLIFVGGGLDGAALAALRDLLEPTPELGAGEAGGSR